MPILPKSANLLDDILNSDKGFNRFFFCVDCFYSFGIVDHKVVHTLVCPVEKCKTVNQIKDLTQATFFVQYDLVPQFQQLFEKNDIWDKLLDPKEALKRNSATLSDLYDGLCYQKFAASINDDIKTISLTICTDGSPLAKSSNLSIWPCFGSVNELPPLIRMKRLLILGLWFGNKKPPMHLFLQPLKTHLASLCTPGFTVISNGNVVPMKCYCIAVCVDSGARGAVQGLNSHSGYFSCNWCEHPGEYLDKAVRFPCLENVPPARTHQKLIADGRRCVQNPTLEYVCGVRGSPPFLNLPKFDLVEGFVQDFPHNVPYGIGRVFLHEWKHNSDRSYYIGSPAYLDEIHKKISLLTPPIEVRRMPRHVTDSKHWKMREYENWILLFSVIVLTGILPAVFLNHWALLVQAVFFLSLDNVSQSQVNTAHMLLAHFVSGVEKLYGKRLMTYNVHILLHLAESVARWGSVFAISSYAFENGNGELKKVIHAQRGIPHQIQRFISEKQAFEILKNHCGSEKTEAFIESIYSKPKTKKMIRVGESVLIGKPSGFKPTDEENCLCDREILNYLNCEEYKKVIHRKCVYTQENTRKRKTDNSVAILRNGKIVLIQKFLFDRTSENVYVFCVDLTCENFLKFPPGLSLRPDDHCIRIITHQSARLRLIKIEDLRSVCCRSNNLNDKSYVSLLPNLCNVF